MLDDHLEHQRQEQTESAIRINEEKLAQQRERRRQRDKSRLAQLTDDQLIKRKSQRRQYERNRVARMNDEQLKQYRAQKREQDRQRRRRQRETRFQHSSGIAHAQVELKEGVQHHLIDVNANPTNATEEITNVRDDQDISLMKEAAASADGDSGTDGQSAVGAAEDGNLAADAGAIGQGDTEAAGTRIPEAQIPIAAIPIRARTANGVEFLVVD